MVKALKLSLSYVPSQENVYIHSYYTFEAIAAVDMVQFIPL